jgi:hypothetical protein
MLQSHLMMKIMKIHQTLQIMDTMMTFVKMKMKQKIEEADAILNDLVIEFLIILTPVLIWI